LLAGSISYFVSVLVHYSPPFTAQYYPHYYFAFVSYTHMYTHN